MRLDIPGANAFRVRLSGATRLFRTAAYRMLSGRRMGLVFLAACALGTAAAAQPAELGARAGTTLGTLGNGFSSRVLSLRLDLPWQHVTRNDWRFQTALELGVGRLTAHGDQALLANTSLHLRAHWPHLPVAFSLGGGPTYLGEPIMNGRYFGGHLQFSTELGIDLFLGRRYIVGYRVQHLSNGGLHHYNEGLDLQTLSLSVSF